MENQQTVFSVNSSGAVGGENHQQQLIEEQIKQAIANSLSMNEQVRSQSLTFLTTECEPNPDLQLALLNIIARNHFLNGSS